jgi:eukaryotic-like serine/threonine-protein kinase
MKISIPPSNGGTRHPPPDRLSSWKEIAGYLERDVTTVRRWEKTLGLPVYRLQRQKLGAVYAFQGEIDAWLRSRTQSVAPDALNNGDSGPAIEALDATPAAPAAITEREPGAIAKPKLRRGTIALVVLAVAAGAVAGWYIRKLELPDAEPVFRIVTTRMGDRMVTAAAIAGDGRHLAYAVQDGTVMVQTMGEDRTKWLPSPRDFAVERLHWFTGEAALCVSGLTHATRQPSIWRVSLSGERPRLLRNDARDCVPSPDGTRIAFTNSSRSEIRVMEANGASETRVVSSSGDEIFPVLLWSPDARRLAYQRRSPVHDRNGGVAAFADEELGSSRTYESRDLQSGSLLATARECRMDSAVALKDGRIIFTRYQPNGLTNRIWEVQTDLRTGALVGAPRQITKRPVFSSGITATADGLTISAVVQHSSQPDVYVAAFDPATESLQPGRRLTSSESEDYPQAWTADSSAVIFESSRNGTYDLLRRRIDGTEAEVMVATPRAEFMPQLSPDGQWILYSSAAANSSKMELWRAPVAGGNPAQVPIGDYLDEFRCPGQGAGKCVLRTIEGNRYVFSDLDPVRGKGAELARTAFAAGLRGDWSLSADGRYVALPSHSPAPAFIRVLPLDSTARGAERLVAVPGVTGLRAVRWAPKGDGWFIASSSRPGFTELQYVDFTGAARLLREIAAFSWALPSPDGKMVAYVDHPGLSSNVWFFERD